MSESLSTPMLVLDVDGVVNVPDGQPGAAARAGLRQVRFEFAHAPISTTVTWDPAVIRRINALVDDGGVEPVWCTTWKSDANRLADVVGLHGAPWPVIWAEGHNDSADPAGWCKSVAVLRATKGRDCVWVDDDLGPEMRAVAAARFGPRVALVTPDSGVGLSDADLDTIEELVRSAGRRSSP